MLLYWGRYVTSDDGIQVAFDHQSDLYSSDVLQQLAHQISRQYGLLSKQLREQEDVMIRTAPDLTESEIVFLNPATEIDRSRPDIVVARVTNLRTLCRTDLTRV